MSLKKIPAGKMTAASIMTFRDPATGETVRGTVTDLAAAVQSLSDLSVQAFVTQHAAPSSTTAAPGPSPGPAPSPTPAPAPSPAPAPPPVGTVLTTLVAQEETGAAGARTYSATVLPLRGFVPAGTALESPDDGTLRGAVLATHTDGSAALVVVSGTVTVPANGTTTVRLQAGTPAAGTALNTAAIAAQVTNVTASAGALGTAVLTTFTSPERVWWSNARTICAQYRVPFATPGSTSLEMVVYIQAWSDRALVRVVVENGRMTTASPVKPAAAAYTGATVAINGTTVATVNATAVIAETGHNAFRGWAASRWVGAGDPGIRITQQVADLQQHPLLFKMDQPSNVDMSVYAADAYTPWSTGRQRATYMGNGGSHPSIGPVPNWDAQWLQTGDYRAARAVESNTLAVLGWNINHRNGTTGRVPTLSEVSGRSINGTQNWPTQTNVEQAQTWEVMHHPAAGLMAFIVRPDPIYIEVAQRVALWNALWSNNGGGITGVFARGDYPTRGRAWGLRSLAHATFLTPDGDPWKTAGKVSISQNVDYLHTYTTDSKAKLNVMWEGDPAAPQNAPYATAPLGASFALAGWMYHYLITELHKLASVELLTGAEQTKLAAVADWTARFPVRWINEQPNGAWRFIPYATAIGRNPVTIDSLDDWGAQRAYSHTGSPASVSGTWQTTTADGPTDYTLASYAPNNSANPALYVSYFWPALVAAVERNVAGAAQAWATVLANVTNLATWRQGFRELPQWGAAPRNLYGAMGYVAGSTAAGAFTDATAVTTANAFLDTAPEGGGQLGPIEMPPDARPLYSWPGNLTWDAAGKRVISIGASNGTASYSPAGGRSCRLDFDVTSGRFVRQWSPLGQNVTHQYDANCTAPAGGFLWRHVSITSSIFKVGLLNRVATYVGDTGGVGVGNAQAPSADIHPGLGAKGSFVLASFGGRLTRYDIDTGVQSVITASQAGVGGLEVLCAYHPSIASIVFGGGVGGTSLYRCDAAGVVSLVSSTLPPGVTAITPDGNQPSVLAPDPQGRPFAWLFNYTHTQKVWRLDLASGVWTDFGLLPLGLGINTCVATVPELGVHLLFEHRERQGGLPGARVWVYRPQ